MTFPHFSILQTLTGKKQASLSYCLITFLLYRVSLPGALLSPGATTPSPLAAIEAGGKNKACSSSVGKGTPGSRAGRSGAVRRAGSAGGTAAPAVRARPGNRGGFERDMSSAEPPKSQSRPLALGDPSPSPCKGLSVSLTAVNSHWAAGTERRDKAITGTRATWEGPSHGEPALPAGPRATARGAAGGGPARLCGPGACAAARAAGERRPRAAPQSRFLPL